MDPYQVISSSPEEKSSGFSVTSTVLTNFMRMSFTPPSAGSTPLTSDATTFTLSSGNFEEIFNDFNSTQIEIVFPALNLLPGSSANTSCPFTFTSTITQRMLDNICTNQQSAQTGNRPFPCPKLLTPSFINELRAA